MATVTQREIVDTIIANDGVYPGDPPVIKIVEYENTFDGGKAWGLVYEGEDPMRYHMAPACRNPRTIWPQAEPTYPRTCPTCRGTGGGVYNDCPTCGGNGVV